MKITIYILLLVLAGFIVSRSVYIKRPPAPGKAVQGRFDAAGFAAGLWKDQLPAKLDSAVDLATLMSAVQANRDAAFARYSRALAIGNYRYSLIRLQGTVTAINEDDVTLQVQQADSLLNVKLVTEFVYGNAIRDASGLVDIKRISDPAALNDVSAALNQLVRSTVLPALEKQLQQGQQVAVTGAVQLNKEYPRFDALELIPLRVKNLP